MMTPLSIQVTYRKGRPLAAYIYIDRRPGEKSARSEEIGPEIVADFASDGRPIGVEIINPDIVTAEDILAAFDRLGLRRPEIAELSPLVAA